MEFCGTKVGKKSELRQGFLGVVCKIGGDNKAPNLLQFKVKQFFRKNPQRRRYLKHLADAGIDNAPLDAADLAELKVRGIGKLLLREALGQPDLPQVFPKCFDAMLVPRLFFHRGNFPLCQNFSLGKFALFEIVYKFELLFKY
jgi:hypothetical protein